jgi:flagellar basal body-associated protein FliL
MIRHVRLGVLALLGFAGGLPPLVPGTAWAEEHAAPRPAYIALGEFTINLPAKNEQMSYAVISITIEAVPEAATDLRSVEPRLKELVMRRLMAMADRGVLQPSHTDLGAIKQALMSSISELQPNSVRDVLIVRLLYG